MYARRHQRSIHILVATVAFSAQVYGAVAQLPASEVRELAPSGTINWTAGWVEATGLGRAPEAASPQQARATTERDAYIAAQRHLLEIVKGLRLDAETLLEGHLARQPATRTTVSDVVHGGGAMITRKDVEQDGTVRVTVGIRLWGNHSLIEHLTADREIQSQRFPGEPLVEEGATGVVIDARGLGVKPAVFPVVLDEAGTVVYGPAIADRATVEAAGLVEYRGLSGDAPLSSGLGPQAWSSQAASLPGTREGKQPLTMTAVGTAGTLSVNIVLNSKDARAIRDDPHLMVALKRARIVIVTEPFIK